MIWREIYDSNNNYWITKPTERKKKEDLTLVIRPTRVGVFAKTDDEIYVLRILPKKFELLKVSKVL